MDSDEKRQDCFRRGLNTKLQDKLDLTTCANFTELVNKAITQEDATLAHKADKKEEGTRWIFQQCAPEVQASTDRKSAGSKSSTAARPLGC